MEPLKVEVNGKDITPMVKGIEFNVDGVAAAIKAFREFGDVCIASSLSIAATAPELARTCRAVQTQAWFDSTGRMKTRAPFA